ncbi:hypothetical protein [Rickettsia endosymbiont of Culicoides newsteadi]|uniref:hypothetical protein n=1 Tax=Rickettsia endosymbiont of Culicoides newsteadi TaxID=1961830 RepID=UPI0012FFCAB7|nr:hypothetical protein [Rickettsia endosymbiont of Culicoides newsteadi]
MTYNLLSPSSLNNDDILSILDILQQFRGDISDCEETVRSTKQSISNHFPGLLRRPYGLLAMTSCTL